MFHYPSTSFRPAVPVSATVFHTDGSRTVRGDLGTFRYGADGSVTLLPHPDVREAGALLRLDLGAD